MKYLNRLIIVTLAIFTPLAGCDTDELHDLNVNPQALNEVNMNFLFTAAQLGAAAGGSAGDNRYIDWRTNINYCAYWIQQLASLGAPGDKYNTNVESNSAPWEFFYGDELKNLHEVLKQTGPGGFAEGTKKNTREASRILRAFLFHRLTDYYGNAPYTEALQGIEGVFRPSYDDQQVIYMDLLKELDEASAAISSSNPDEGFAAADLYLNGDVSKWKKWGYTLMLRLAMRISNVDPGTAATYVNKAIAGGVMTGNADNVWCPMGVAPSLWTNQNGISRVFITDDGGVVGILSETLVDMLKGPNTGSTADDDPRLMIFTGGIPGPGDTDPLNQRGMPNGLDGAALDALLGVSGASTTDYFSTINPKLLDRDDPYLLMSYSEAELLQADAKERGIGTVSGTAQSHFEKGVSAACQMYGPFDATLAVSAATADAFAASLGYVDGAGTAEEMIANQLWLSKWFNWWDAWADWRRTGFPALTPTNYPGNDTGGQIPRRLQYPNHETATNGDQLEANGTQPDNLLTKVWWDGGN